MKRKLHFLLAVGIGLTTSVGWLHAADVVTAEDAADLLTKVAAAKDGDTIKLKVQHYELDKQLVINKGIVLYGTNDGPNYSTISAKPGAEWPKKENGEIDNSKANLISIVGGTSGKEVTLENLVVYGSMASGINAQSAMKTVLKVVTVERSNNAALLVHSAVEAKALLTRGNGWGSVNVDKGSNTNYTPNFKFFDDNFMAYEPYKIWTELTTDGVVTVPENSNWKTYTINATVVDGVEKEKAKKYWVQSGLDMEYVAQFPRNTNLKAGYTFVYAKGAPITIQQSSNEGFISINNKDGNSLLELPEKCNPVIFGGSKEALEGNTSITMKSGRVYALIGGGYNANVKDVSLTVNGGTIRQYLVGGGFGPNDALNNAKSANVETVLINVENAAIGYLISGGMEFSKVTSTHVVLNNATVSNALGGGFAPVGDAFSQSLSQSFGNSLNSVEKSTFEMTGGKVTSEIMLGGGFSFSYAKTVTATLNGITFNGGLYGIGFNGFSEDVTAEVKGCTFNKVNPDYNTIAAMVRGKAGKVSMTFDENCKFDSKYECYLGADRDNEYNPAPQTANAIFTFKGDAPIVKVSEDMQDVTVTGAKVNVAPFLRQLSSKTMVSDFTIPAGKTWTFNDGLSMESGVTLTKTGTLSYGKSFDANVSTFAEMQDALGLIKNGVSGADNATTSVIKLEKDLTFDANTRLMGGANAFQGLFYLDAEQTNNLFLTVEGNGKSISGTRYTNDTANDGSKKYLFFIVGDPTTGIDVGTVTVNNLIVKDMDVVGFNVFDFNGLIFNNVAMDNNLQGAVHLNSSVLKATGFTTSGNKKFAVKLSRERANAPGIILNDGCKLGECAKDDVPQIAYYDRSANGTNPGVYSSSAEVAKMVSGTYGNTLYRSWAKADKLHTDKNTPLVRVWTTDVETEYLNDEKNASVTLDSNSSGLDSLLVDYSFANIPGVVAVPQTMAEVIKDRTVPTDSLHVGLFINCKDGYLVTGEKAAAIFAASATTKPVKSLTVADNKFVIGSAITTPTIDKAVSWNDVKYAKQNVVITKNGFLTINVPMELDTVFMAEGAQLVANAAVTAKAVQLTYGTTKVWKAFGFPFAIGSVKNLAGDKEIKTTASTGDGVWTAGIANNAPTFTITAADATPAASCIIASEKDSSIVVTSTGSTLSLATKAEPTAPVVATKADDVNFKIISNPNLSDMTLTQTAYVLSDDGKTFDRIVNPTIKAFQSFVLADEETTSTLRSLRIGDTPTGNEIVPVDGYFVETGHGTITIHTAEPTQVIVVDMLGRVHYNARVNDGAQIAVPAGIYAVNRQKVIVK